MKKIILILVLIGFLVSGCVKVDKVVDEDSSENFINCPIDKDTQRAFCIEVYDPVCGDNGKTYSNSCFACQEVERYKKGEC